MNRLRYRVLEFSLDGTFIGSSDQPSGLFKTMAQLVKELKREKFFEELKKVLLALGCKTLFVSNMNLYFPESNSVREREWWKE